jgi:hypothetical protein
MQIILSRMRFSASSKLAIHDARRPGRINLTVPGCCGSIRFVAEPGDGVGSDAACTDAATADADRRR